MKRSPTLRYNSENDPARLRSRTVSPEKGKGRKRRPRVKRVEAEEITLCEPTQLGGRIEIHLGGETIRSAEEWRERLGTEPPELPDGLEWADKQEGSDST